MPIKPNNGNLAISSKTTGQSLGKIITQNFILFSFPLLNMDAIIFHY